MTDSMLPIIRQMLDAPDDHARAAILLRVPDLVLAKYRDVFEGACRRSDFDAGLAFVSMRVARLCAVRGTDGLVPDDADFRVLRGALAAFAGQGGAS